MSEHEEQSPSREYDPQSLLLIVVGMTIEAEMVHRPLAYGLRERVLRWLDDCPDDVPQLSPVVCTDAWYLNQDHLHAQPMIAVGHPQTNAASAFLATRIDTAFEIEDVLEVHADIEFVDLRAAVWGASGSATASAVDVFCERYLDEFLRSAHGLGEAAKE